MNRIKRVCALLSAIVLVFGIAIEPGIGSAYADDAEPNEVITAQEPTAVSEPGPMPSLFEQLIICGSLEEFDEVLRAGEAAGTDTTLTQEEWKQLLLCVEQLYIEIAEPGEADAQRMEALESRVQEHIDEVCTLCAGTAGHINGCPQYISYVLETASDRELADWIMDAFNARTVIDTLRGEGEDYEALTARIEAILSGEDEALAMSLRAYLAMLMGTDEPETTANTTPGQNGVIYFDLALGDVTIGPNYSGKIIVNGSETDVTGTHVKGNKYYIYQSTAANQNQTGYENETDLDNKTNCQIPVYNRVYYKGQAWTKFVENNINVYAVSDAWNGAATDVDRTGTENNITFTPGSSYDVTIDNIWSTFHTHNASRTDGGITAHLGDNQGTEIQLKLKGDNRVGNVHYYAEAGTKNQIIFSNGDTDQTPGSITVADFPKDMGANYWCSAIGGNDNGFDPADGIVIKSGVIYAGTTSADDCTAIGGGGNEFGRVTISGGTVTAVSASTGTAIGGGIGWGDIGGDADVTISGGTVYAYNHGIGPDSGNYTSFVPAAAIGGGSASTNKGNKMTTVTITGGYVYAQSVAGAAIGGGGSGTQDGGKATVNISGGTVIAKSIGGKVTYTKTGVGSCTENVSAGVSIGGGTGDTSGGAVTLNITKEKGKDAPILRTGSIGGGKCTGGGPIGHATVNITGGDIMGQVIMASGSSDYCTFTMEGGKLHGSNVVDGNKITDITDPQPDVSVEYLEDNGGAVWMDDKNGVATISGGSIESCTAKNGGAVYMTGGSFTLSGDGKISGNTAKNDGGGVYLPGGDFTMEDGSIEGNKATNGGGFYLTKEPKLTKGIIAFNEATENGGGFCVNGGGVKLENANVKIYGNTAKNGGGMAVHGGSVVLSGGSVGVDPDTVTDVPTGKQKVNEATDKGGGIYVLADSGSGTGTGGTGGTAGGTGGTTGSTPTARADVTINDGKVWYNKAEEGGGVYLSDGNGTFTLEGENAVIRCNEATTNGGGIYLYKEPKLKAGRIEQNTAEGNGGGLFICDAVTLAPTGELHISNNHAKNGAGIHIYDNSTGTGGSADVPSTVADATTGATPIPKVGLRVADGYTGHLYFQNNTATDSGGAVCVDAGRFELDSDNITVTGNTAKNGGGVAVLHGNFTMTAGAIGESGGANTATNGGGVYVSGGEIWLKGGSVQYNEATNGGGAYVTNNGATSDKDQFTMLDGILNNNTAEENGGGGYVAGNFHMLAGTIGGNDGGNTAKNGGGIYVSEGNVTVVNGSITHNEASGDGGGFLVSSAKKEVKVVMLSGSLSGNQAGVNGGGMAVESSGGSNKITIDIGCLLDHKVTGGGPSLPINYEGNYSTYAEFGGVPYHHNSCPKVEYNQAGGIGGGFYMNSANSTLSFYCVEETGNSAAGSSTTGMDVDGGTVIIGDSEYHNHEHNDYGKGQGTPRGYIHMDDATLVNGGQVDIYGDMDNPTFRKEVTVDIKDKDNDHFMDHRRTYEGDKSYKVHFIENFKGTGLFQAYQYDESNSKITVEGALYSHPGYSILGWCTEPDRTTPGAHFYEVGTEIDLTAPNVPGMGTHSINCGICGTDQKDANLLEIYAIWEPHGYIVRFDPNVPVGESYTGEMPEMEFLYDQKQNLIPNDFNYPGNFFAGWSLNPDGSGKVYKDKEPVENLTMENGVTVTLYAKWDPCKHDVSERWSYDVINGRKTLRRNCSCGKQTLTATLSAENTVYDGNAHPATLVLDDEDAWGTDKPEVEYKSEWLDDGLTHATPTPELTATNEPFHAGNYTATITKTYKANGADVTAEAKTEYTIDKAEQTPPEKPEYTVTNDVVSIAVVAPNNFTDAKGKRFTAEAQYRLSYYQNDTLTYTSWEKKTPTETDRHNITMEQAWTSYNIEARYEELADYKPSEIVRADAVYHYTGNVTVRIIRDDGIEAYFQATLNADNKLDGATLKLATRDGYYLIGGEYDVSAVIAPQNNPTSETNFTIGKKDPSKDDEYSVTSVPDDSILTITIGKARKEPKVEAKAAQKQIFSTFTGTETTTSISRDSAFTAAFQISNFDPVHTVDVNGQATEFGYYAEPTLNFSPAIPEKTTIILVDRDETGAKSYWYYRAGSAVGDVKLTEFTKMGDSSKMYEVPAPTKANDYIDLNYQFIVDFSQCGQYPTGILTMTLKAVAEDDATKAPTEEKSVTVTMADSGFGLTKKSEDGLTNILTCTFNAGAAASKWDDRASALILKPDASPKLPPDAQIKAVAGGRTTYLYKTGDAFIAPLSLLQTTEDVTLTLQSALFPAEKKTSYTFSAEWRISPSKAGKAPMNGDLGGVLSSLTFTSEERKVPSMKVTSSQRVLTTQSTLDLNINTQNMDGYYITAALLQKTDDGTFSGTGVNKQNVGGTLSLGLRGLSSGSFCVMFTVKETADSVRVVMEVPYYFVIKPTE